MELVKGPTYHFASLDDAIAVSNGTMSLTEALARDPRNDDEVITSVVTSIKDGVVTFSDYDESLQYILGVGSYQMHRERARKKKDTCIEGFVRKKETAKSPQPDRPRRKYKTNG